MAKSDDTRELIAGTALRLFTERGYAQTTMRAIATEAGVSPSNAYYYFRSKEELIQQFYVSIQTDHAARAAQVLSAGGGFASRLHAVLHHGLDAMAPFHDFGGSFVAVAISPDSQANPFSEQSTPARDLSLRIFRDVVAGCDPALPSRIRPVLPDLLWLCQVGVTLFWVSDSSPAQQRTRDLVDATVPLIAGMVKLARLPLTGSVIDQLSALLGVVLPKER